MIHGRLECVQPALQALDDHRHLTGHEPGRRRFAGVGAYGGPLQVICGTCGSPVGELCADCASVVFHVGDPLPRQPLS